MEKNGISGSQVLVLFGTILADQCQPFPRDEFMALGEGVDAIPQPIRWGTGWGGCSVEEVLCSEMDRVEFLGQSRHRPTIGIDPRSAFLKIPGCAFTIDLQNKWIQQDDLQLRVRLATCGEEISIASLVVFQSDVFAGIIDPDQNGQHIGIYGNGIVQPAGAEILHGVPRNPSIDEFQAWRIHAESCREEKDIAVTKEVVLVAGVRSAIPIHVRDRVPDEQQAGALVELGEHGFRG